MKRSALRLVALVLLATGLVTTRAGAAATTPREDAEAVAAALPPADPARAKREVAHLLARLASVVPDAPPNPLEAAALLVSLDATLGSPHDEVAGACAAEVVGTHDFGTWRIDRVVLTTPQGVVVTASLWYPVRREPVPAVVSLHGHLGTGKSDPEVVARCLDLVRRGIATIALDRWGYGERMFLGPRHDRAFELFAADTTLLGWELADVACAVDYLAERRMGPIGVAGESGGGLLAALAAVRDPRIRAAAAAVALSSAEGDLVQGECGCNYIPSLLPRAELPDLVGLATPKPLLLTVGLRDRYVTLASARAAASRVRAAYIANGAASALEVRETAGGHAFDAETIGLAGDFFERKLGPLTPTPGVPTELPPGTDLDCLRSGRERRGAPSELVAALQRELRPRASAVPVATREALTRVLAPGRPISKVARTARVAVGDLLVEPLELETEPRLHLTGLALSPASGTPKATWLWLTPRGARAAILEALPLVRRGHAVVLGDLRGQGEHPGGRQDKALLYMAQAAGRPLLGQRLHDAQAWVEVARAMDPRRRVFVVGEAESGALALLLAQAEGVAGVVTLGAPITLFAEEGEDPRWGLPPSLAVTGLSRVGDVADWAGLARAPVIVMAPRLRSGAPASPADAAWARMAQASPLVTVESLASDFWRRLATFAEGQRRE